MPTVLDSFVLEFNLDPSKFTKGQRDILDSMRKTQQEALRQANEIEGHSKHVFDLLSNMRREALTALGVFFGGQEIGQFVRHITSLDAATGKLATTLGMSAEETSAWQGALRQAGGTTEDANAALSGLSNEMVRFRMTGQSSMLPVLSRLGISLYDSNHNLKTAGQLWLELSEAVKGMDAREATAFLQMIPGATQGMVNFALMGRGTMTSFLEAAKAAGVTTAQSAAAARDYQRALEQLEASSSNLGRTLVTAVAPAISAVSTSLATLLQSWGKTPGSGADKEASASQREKLISRFGDPHKFMDFFLAPFGMKSEGNLQEEQMDSARALLATKVRNYRAPTAPSSSGEVEGMIRQGAISRGMDPEVAVQVYRSEGQRSYIGDAGSSFGPFQLHYGGVAGGGNAVSGLGDVFTKQTGLDARDPSTTGKQVDFSLDWAKKNGWGAWHGWKGAPFAGGAGGGGGRSSTVNVGGVTVNTNSGNADGIASEIDGALKRSISAGAANYGAQ